MLELDAGQLHLRDRVVEREDVEHLLDSDRTGDEISANACRIRERKVGLDTQTKPHRVGDHVAERRVATSGGASRGAAGRVAHQEVEVGHRVEPLGVTQPVPRDGLELVDEEAGRRRAVGLELRLALEDEQRDLPGHPPLAIGVVVKLVHHDVVGAPGAVAQRHVGQDLGGAADDRRVAVDAGVAGQHPDLLRAKQPAEIRRTSR